MWRRLRSEGADGAQSSAGRDAGGGQEKGKERPGAPEHNLAGAGDRTPSEWGRS
ncbi:hypothetical protein T484DRAFT_1929909 [Baffinella frigidus]|nr:hypothetical protein T484DRAFT_1929909 [Cryptophyta sp. CCMP2293]